jgi:hypothetical protein
MIWQNEIQETRKLMWDDALSMSDDEIIELLCQIKKMVALAIEFIEKETI